MTSVFAVLAASLIASGAAPKYEANLSLTEDGQLTVAQHMDLLEGSPSTYVREINGERMTIRLTPSAMVDDKIKLQIYLETASTNAASKLVRKMSTTIDVKPGDPLIMTGPRPRPTQR